MHELYIIPHICEAELSKRYHDELLFGHQVIALNRPKKELFIFQCAQKPICNIVVRNIANFHCLTQITIIHPTQNPINRVIGDWKWVKYITEEQNPTYFYSWQDKRLKVLN
jgi:hypothetical protein